MNGVRVHKLKRSIKNRLFVRLSGYLTLSDSLIALQIAVAVER